MLSDRQCWSKCFLKNKWSHRVAYLIIIALLEVFFFRSVISIDALIGDRGDSRLNNLILEHWYHFFCGKETFCELSEFYPLKNTISYTDMLLGEGVFYSLLRAVGVGMYVADKIVFIALHVIGSYSLFFLITEYMGKKDYSALVAVMVFSFSNSYSLRVPHTQLFAISFLPIVFLLVAMAIRFRENKLKRRLLTFASIVLFATIAYSGWYIFFYACVFIAIFAVWFIVVYLIFDRALFKKIVMSICSNIIEIVTFLIILVAMMIPFLKIYLKTSSMSGGRSWDTVLSMLPKPLEILDVGASNLVLGKLCVKVFEANLYGIWDERFEGISVVVLLLFVVASIMFIVRRFITKKSRKNGGDLVMLALVLSIVFAIFLTFKFGDKSIWWIFWKYLPGANSLRAMNRWYFFLMLPIAMVLALLIDRVIRVLLEKRTIRKDILLLAVVTLIFVFDVNTLSMSEWNRISETLFINGVSNPPEGASVIAVRHDKVHANLPINQLDAWQIADHFGLRTVNGYSGIFPEHFEYLDTSRTNVENSVLCYCDYYGVEDDIYIYNVEDGTWLLASAPQLQLNTGLSFADDGWAVFDIGWFDMETAGRWMADEASISFSNTTEDTTNQSDYVMKLNMCSFYLPAQMRILVNDTEVASLTVIGDASVYSVTIPYELMNSQDVKITFVIDSTIYSPSDVLDNNCDIRELGVWFNSVSFERS